MKELVMEQHLKAAYTQLHAPESLIRSVLRQINSAHPAARNTNISFPEGKREGIEAGKKSCPVH